MHITLPYNKNQFYSVNAKTGTINWINNINSNITPVIIGKLLFTVSNEGYLFVLDNQGADRIVEYTCSTAFDVSTCSDASSDLALVDGSGTALDASDAFEFSSDGKKLYIADPGNDLIQEYILGAAWDVSSAGHNNTFDISDQEPAARGLAFGDNGRKLYVTGTSDTVWQFNLG